MIVIKCHECKRRYNWAGDPFCPNCGAFNQAKDYSFDRERVEVTLDDEDAPKKVRYQRKKTSTGQANAAPNRPVPPRNPQEKREQEQAQASGCLKKIIIAVVVWNVGIGLLSVLANMIFEMF